MFGLGISEILIIVMAVFILLSPKDFLKVTRNFGKWYKQLLNMKNTISKITDDELTKIADLQNQTTDNSAE